MIIDKKNYEELDASVSEWETAGKVQGGSTENVSIIMKELVSILKMSDRMNLDEITAILIFIIRAINSGQDDVIDLCHFLYDEYESEYENDGRPMPGPGETGMINPDGSYVTLKQLEEELGIEL